MKIFPHIKLIIAIYEQIDLFLTFIILKTVMDISACENSCYLYGDNSILDATVTKFFAFVLFLFVYFHLSGPR